MKLQDSKKKTTTKYDSIYHVLRTMETFEPSKSIRDDHSLIIQHDNDFGNHGLI